MTGMINLGSGVRTSHPVDANPNRLAASPQEETQTGGDMPERSALPRPNRAAHERLQSQQLQRMLNENRGTHSTLLQAPSHNQREEASTSASKNDSQAEPSESGIWRMVKVLSNFLPWSRVRLSPREELQRNLAKVKKHFETLKAANWSPDRRELYCDVALLPIAVKAENAREPRLNLHNFDSFHSFAGALKRGRLQNGRVIFPLLGEEVHAAAADIRMIDDKISILVLEPIGIDELFDKYCESHISAMFKALPENAKLAVLSVDAQRAANGCRIFALSAASKLAKESEFFDEIHKANASDQVQALKQINKAEIENRLSNAQLGDNLVDVHEDTRFPNFRILNAHRLVSASFQKHTQSKNSLKAWADEDKLAQIMVNKKGETLLSRFDKHIVERYKRKQYEESGKIQWSERRSKSFSASIEEKRLTYLDRAIAYLDNVPQKEAFDLLRCFYEAWTKYRTSDLSDEKKYVIDMLAVGPQNMQSRPEIDF